MAKVLFQDSFDIDIYGSKRYWADSGTRWYSVPLSNGFLYKEGYLTGQAADHWSYLDGGGQMGNAIPLRPYGYNNLPRSEKRKRVCWFAKGYGDGTSSVDNRMWIRFGWGLAIAMSFEGRFRAFMNMGRLDQGDYPISDLSNSATYLEPDNWQYFELLLDCERGRFTFWKDGFEIFNIDLSQVDWKQVWPDFTYQEWLDYLQRQTLDIGGRNDTSRARPLMDHIVVTDGDRLEKGRVHCLAPTMSAAGLGWPTGAFHGTLIIDGQRYQTFGKSAGANAGRVFPTIPPAPADTEPWTNESDVKYFPFPVNPATLQPWDENSLTSIEAWGLCTSGMRDTDDPDAGDITKGGFNILWSLGLSVVETISDPEGRPIIRTYPASDVTYLTKGIYLKSHPQKSMVSHINDIPRTEGTPSTTPKNKYLLIDQNGCLLFNYPPKPSPVFEDLGITFAEEYRTDYMDWVKIYGGESFDSYFTSGYSVLGDADKEFQSNYVSVNFENSQPVGDGGGYIQGVWDYSTSGTTGRWTNRQNIYRLAKPMYKHQIAKLKIRGHGEALQLRITSEDFKEFNINGWSILVTANKMV